jgi:hypothetical protein
MPPLAPPEPVLFEPGKYPVASFDASKLETVKPLTSDAFWSLLKTNKPHDWEHIIKTLTSHHLVLLPRDYMIPRPVLLPVANLQANEPRSTWSYEISALDFDSSLGANTANARPILSPHNLLSERAKKHALAHSKRVAEQQAAAARRKAARGAAHNKRLAEQQAAKERRVAARKARHEALTASRAARTSAASGPVQDYGTLRTGGDVIRHARHLETETARALSAFDGADMSSARLALQTITFPVGRRLVVRKTRAPLSELPLGFLANHANKAGALKLMNKLVSEYNMLDARLKRLFHDGPRIVSSPSDSGSSVEVHTHPVVTPRPDSDPGWTVVKRKGNKRGGKK